MDVDINTLLKSSLGGQWAIHVEGAVSGWGLLSFDEENDGTGQISLWQTYKDDASRGFEYFGRVRILSESGEQFTLEGSRLNETGGRPFRAKLVARRVDERRCTGEWESSDQLNGSLKLTKLSARLGEKEVPTARTWAELSSWAFDRVGINNLVFRGMSQSSWPLTTTLQRVGCYDLVRYLERHFRWSLGSYIALTESGCE